MKTGEHFLHHYHNMWERFVQEAILVERGHLFRSNVVMPNDPFSYPIERAQFSHEILFNPNERSLARRAD